MVSSGQNLLSFLRTSTESKPSEEGARSADEEKIRKTIDSSSSNINALDQDGIRRESLTSNCSQTTSSVLRSDSIIEASKWTSSTKAIKWMCSSTSTSSTGPFVTIEEVRNEGIPIADEQNAETNFSSMDDEGGIRVE